MVKKNADFYTNVEVSGRNEKNAEEEEKVKKI